jgi:hypothetical protein
MGCTRRPAEQIFTIRSGDGENLSENRSIAKLVCDGHAMIRRAS